MFTQSFDGTSGKRPVSMSGRKRENDKATVLAKARAERAAREIERKRATAGQIAQRWLRGRHAASCARAAMRATWDQQVTQLNVVLATFRAKGIPFVPPLPSVLIFSRQLLFFHRPSCAGDRERVVTLASLVLSSSAAPDPVAGFLGVLADDEACRQRAFLAARLCAVALRHATGLHLSGDSTEGLAALCALLDALTGHASARRVALLLAARCGTPSALCAAVTACAAAPGALEAPFPALVLRVALLAVNADGGPAAAAAGGGGSGGLEELQAEAHDAFAREVLGVLASAPHGARSMVAGLAEALGRGGGIGWWHLVEASERVGQSGALPGLLALAGGRVLDEQSGARGGAVSRVSTLVRLLYRHVTALPAAAFLEPTSSAAAPGAGGAADDDDYEEEEEEEEEVLLGEGGVANGLKGLELRLTQEHRRASAASTTGAAADATGAAHEAAEVWTATVAALVRPQTLCSLFGAVLPTEGGAALMGPDDPALLLCAVYGRILALCRPGSPVPGVVLTVLALGKVPCFLERLWAHLARIAPRNTTGPPEAATSSSSSSSLSSSVLAAAEPSEDESVGWRRPRATLEGAPNGAHEALLLLASVFGRVLVAVNDDDFFDRGLPLPPTAQRAVVLMLNDHLFEMLWERPVADAPGPWDARLLSLQLLANHVKLFNALYDRHARRSFARLGRDHFHWPRGTASRELSEAMGEGAAEGATPAFRTSAKVSLLLTCIPQVLPFRQRVKIFQRLIDGDKAALGLDDRFHFHGTGVLDVTVNREAIYDDALVALEAVAPLGLKGRVRVTFESGLGYDEAGIDGGGLFRDFVDSLASEAFDPAKRGLFRENEDHVLSPNPGAAVAGGAHLRHFAFLGRVLGFAVYHQILVKPSLALPFLSKLLDRTCAIDDLASLDAELHRHLMSLKALARDGVDLETLCLFFTVGTSAGGRAGEAELVPGGRDRPVTNDNFLEYQYRLAHFKLTSETHREASAFLRGFHDLVPVDWIKMFDARELQMVIGGETRALDLANLMQWTAYHGGYHPSQPTMHWLWEVLAELTPEQQGDFLRFVTGSPRQPLLGFEYMNPRFAIQKVPLDPGGHKLPSAATCMALLKLPDYPSKDVLRAKLIYAISANAGFELS